MKPGIFSSEFLVVMLFGIAATVLLALGDIDAEMWENIIKWLGSSYVGARMLVKAADRYKNGPSRPSDGSWGGGGG